MQPFIVAKPVPTASAGTAVGAFGPARAHLLPPSVNFNGRPPRLAAGIRSDRVEAARPTVPYEENFP